MIPLGKVLKNAKSYKAIWDGPSYPILQPECDPTHLTVFALIPAILI